MTATAHMRSGLRKLGLVVTLLLVGLGSGPARPEGAGTQLTTAELEQLVAPVALYPDTLLSQVLMAATYPLEVVEAARWSKENPKVTGKALEDAMQKQPWDPNVKALTAVPQTLYMMNDQLKWTQDLGDAFLAQQTDVLDAVQRLRARADAAGNLKSTPQQRVTRTNRPASVPATGGAPATAYVIEPAYPDEYFVPIYDPGVVYGVWPYATYRPFYWYPPDYVAAGVFGFATGVFVGAAIWGNVNWWNRRVDINVNRYNQFNRTRITSNTWNHDTAHRHGVAYNNPNVAAQFGDKGRDKQRDAARQKIAEGKGGKGQGGKGGMGDGGKGGMGAGGKGAGGKGAGGKGAGSKVAGGGMGDGGMGGMGDGGMGGMGGMGGAAKSAGGMAAGGMAGGGMAGGGGGMGGMAANLAGGGMGGMVGGGMVGGGMAGGGMGGGGMGGGGMRRSDVALKHDIVLLGYLGNGLGFYRFAYNGSDTAYVGVMAQEVQRVRPDAVVRGRDGHLSVFYDKLGLTFQTYDQWVASGAQVPSIAGPRE